MHTAYSYSVSLALSMKEHLITLCLCAGVFSLAIRPSSGAVRTAVMLGAPEEMVREDLSDPYVQAAANFAVLGINNMSKGKRVRVLVDVVEGTTQVSLVFMHFPTCHFTQLST